MEDNVDIGGTGVDSDPEMDKQVLLDFRLSRGDGIEFKRR